MYQSLVLRFLVCHGMIRSLRDLGFTRIMTQVKTIVTPWTVAHQAPLSMRFSRQGYWSGLPFPSPGDLPNPGIEPRSPALQADSLLTELQGKPRIITQVKIIYTMRT